MRVITLAAALSFLLSTAFAQTETPTGKTDNLCASYTRYRCASDKRRSPRAAFHWWPSAGGEYGSRLEHRWSRWRLYKNS
jgi:hypothetical protein